MSDTLTHADHRRAAALAIHRASLSLPGIEAVFAEANDAGRPTQLLTAVVDLYCSMIGQLRTDVAQDLVTQFIECCAQKDADTKVSRGARVILAHHRGDLDAFNAELTKANADPAGPAALVGSAVDLMAMLLPELATPAGLAQLRKWLAEVSRREMSGE